MRETERDREWEREKGRHGEKRNRQKPELIFFQKTSSWRGWEKNKKIKVKWQIYTQTVDQWKRMWFWILNNLCFQEVEKMKKKEKETQREKKKIRQNPENCMSARQFPPVETGRSDQSDILDIRTNFVHEGRSFQHIGVSNLSPDCGQVNEKVDTNFQKRKNGRMTRTKFLSDRYCLSRLGAEKKEGKSEDEAQFLTTVFTDFRWKNVFQVILQASAWCLPVPTWSKYVNPSLHGCQLQKIILLLKKIDRVRKFIIFRVCKLVAGLPIHLIMLSPILFVNWWPMFLDRKNNESLELWFYSTMKVVGVVGWQ